MKLYQPFVEVVTDKKPVAELYQNINLDKGLFSVIVERELNRLPEERRK